MRGMSRQDEWMLVRAIKSVVLAALGWLVVTTLPDLARYLRMRAM
jgi:hypothetical protein